MSKVAIKGNASGTGTFTLEAPNSNTDRTLVLPDEAGTVITSGSYVAGITGADVWRLTANFEINGDITVNLERSDDASSGLIGSGVSESSGIFTFPETGIWQVSACAYVFISAQDSAFIKINVSTDGGSNYDEVAVGGAGNSGGGTACVNTASCSALVDCTSTANVKVKFTTSSVTAASFTGQTLNNSTFFTFVRLGDT